MNLPTKRSLFARGLVGKQIGLPTSAEKRDVHWMIAANKGCLFLDY
ncbi:hypothetical protein [Anoxybacteroides rupiense]|nr:hypothetical protein [Anoxybacillus rupiensis]MBB3908528.1 hypothetical protein [Anoxybacillus rupiensis]